MSTEWIVGVALVALALASYSVRRLVALPRAERVGRLAVLVVSGLFGLALATIADRAWWPLGLVVGVAVVEVGPVAYRALAALVRRKGGDL